MALILFGALGGLLAGYLGIGGGIIFVPILYFFMPKQSVYHAQMVVATSCTTKFFTTLSSIHRHIRLKNVVWNLYPLYIGGIIGAVAGAIISTSISGIILKQVIGVVIAIVGISSFFKNNNDSSETKPRKGAIRYFLFPIGLFIGMVAGGIGGTGGAMTVPILLFLFRYKPENSAGSSSVNVFGISLFSAAVYLLRGKVCAAELPPDAWGFIDIKSAAFLAIGSIPAAQLGAYLHKYGTPKFFYRIFAVVMLAVAIKMLYFS